MQQLHDGGQPTPAVSASWAYLYGATSPQAEEADAAPEKETGATTGEGVPAVPSVEQAWMTSLKRLCARPRQMTFIRVSGLGVGVEILTHQIVKCDNLYLLRLVLAPGQRLFLEPADDIKIQLPGESAMLVTFLGDLHDLDGLLPFQIATFICKPQPS